MEVHAEARCTDPKMGNFYKRHMHPLEASLPLSILSPPVGVTKEFYKRHLPPSLGSARMKNCGAVSFKFGFLSLQVLTVLDTVDSI